MLLDQILNRQSSSLSTSVLCPCSEALRARLEEDRRERRRRLGLPEELTEEEKAREAERARKKAEQETAKRQVFGHVKPISGEWGGA